jgi:hypothetical protein
MIKMDFDLSNQDKVTWKATCNSERSAQVQHGAVWHDTRVTGIMLGGRHIGKLCSLLCPLDDNNKPIREGKRWVPQAMIDFMP